jgi:hypothetical protein
VDYLPQIKETDERLFSSIEQLEEIIGPVRVIAIPILHDCQDGFLCAYWRRPHLYLDKGVRSAISTFARITDIRAGLQRLKEVSLLDVDRKACQYSLKRRAYGAVQQPYGNIEIT